MRERGGRALLGVTVLVSVAPLLFLLMCPQRATCLQSMWPPSLWLAGVAKVGLALSAASLVAWATRLAWLLRVDARLVHALPARVARLRPSSRPPCWAWACGATVAS